MSRYVTVGSICHSPGAEHKNNVEALLKDAEQYAVRAARMGADIVAYTEIYPHLPVGKIEAWPEAAEAVPGVTTEYMADVARRNSMYIIWPLVERSGERIYNASVLLDRQGKIVGIYHKMFPTIDEINAGVTPGTEPHVFQTDFGKIGLCICFDMNFRPVIEGLVKNGAEIIFFSSMYRGGLQLQAWANEFGVYFVSSVPSELGQIIDMGGKVLAEVTFEKVITARINLNRRWLHMDYNWDKMDAMLEKHGKDISFQYYTREARYLISSEREGLDIDDVLNEFEIERLSDYFARATRIRNEAVAKAGGGSPS